MSESEGIALAEQMHISASRTYKLPSSPPSLGGRVSRRLYRRSEELGVVWWGRKAETDRVREGISEGFRSTRQHQQLRRYGSLELFPPSTVTCGYVAGYASNRVAGDRIRRQIFNACIVCGRSI
jgi:hypothetical protein